MTMTGVVETNALSEEMITGDLRGEMILTTRIGTDGFPAVAFRGITLMEVGIVGVQGTMETTTEIVEEIGSETEMMEAGTEKGEIKTTTIETAGIEMDPTIETTKDAEEK